MSNLGIAGFEGYRKKGELKTPTREDLEKYFEEIFYHKPNKKQLEMFHNYLIGKENDAEKMLSFCCASYQSDESLQMQIEKNN